jgi:hypothetical protein
MPNHHHSSPIERPKNQKALALYLLMEAGTKGVNTFEAIKTAMFWKISARISDLILDYGVAIHKKQEKFKNRFGHSGSVTRYCLYENEKEKNIKIYNRINAK